MVAPIPTAEPLSARAGDTWRWQRALPDYPAPLWTLSYTLFASSGIVTFSSTPDGSQHRIHLAPSATAAYLAGRHDWIAHVSDGTDRHQVASGVMQVLPNLSEAASYDGRSHARKVLDALNALLEQRASAGDVDLVSAATGDKNIARSLPDLLKLRDRYAAMVAQETTVAAGGRPGFIQMRF